MTRRSVTSQVITVTTRNYKHNVSCSNAIHLKQSSTTDTSCTLLADTGLMDKAIEAEGGDGMMTISKSCGRMIMNFLDH